MVVRNFELWRKIAKEASKALLPLINFVCAIHVTRTYALDVASIPGPSMLPTFTISGDIVLVDRIWHRLNKIVPGDIVIVVSPENPRKVITKRLIALEDDTVTYLVDPKNSEKCKTVVVPKGHLWVQGDNIYASRDSRDFGSVPYGLLYGKVFWRVSQHIQSFQ
ncbi:Mitochondrial inner membrane protease subunit 1 [Bienertia sinuspersici]